MEGGGFRKRESLGGRVRRTRKKQTRELRQNETPAEARFWSMVRGSRLGMKFRRQHQIGDWIVDFYCHEAKLIVELLGSVHSGPAMDTRDGIRRKNLESRGFKMIEIQNELVIRNPRQVEKDLRRELVPPGPSPAGGGSAAPAAGVGVEE